MQATAQIISKLRNARFDPGKGAKEKLAWINDTEAAFLRSIGGSGKKRKFGLPSFSWRDDSNSSNRSGTNDGNGGSRDAGGNVHGTGSGSGEGGRGGLTGRAAAQPMARVPVPRQKPVVVPPVVPPPVTVVPPPVPLAPVPIPHMKPAVPVQPTITPQNYGFVAPAMTPKVAAPVANVQPQNYGFAAPMRAAPAAPKAAPMTRAAEIRTDRMAPATRAPATAAPRDDRMPSGGFQPTSYSEPRARTDRMPAAPGAGIRAVPEGPRTDRMPSGSFQPASYHAPAVRDDRMARKTRADVPGLSGTFDGGRRFGTQRTIGSPATAPRVNTPEPDIAAQNYGFVTPDRPAPMVGIPKQDIRRDLTDIHPLGNPEKFSYPRGMAKTLTGVNPDALNMALETQRRFGQKLVTTSGLRNPFQNKKADGVGASQHILGNALDFAISDTTGAETARLLDAMRRSGFTGRGGYRPGKVHGDVRAKETLWGPDTHTSSIGRLPRDMQDALRGAGKYAGMDDY